MTYPKFKVGDFEFQVIAREGAVSYDIAVVQNKNGAQESWGGSPDTRSVIVEDITDDIIMAKGSRRDFILWAEAEGLRRAQIRVNSLRPPVPDHHTQKVANTIWNLEFSTSEVPDKSHVEVAPAPLP